MSKTLDDAIKVLAETYQSLDAVAQGLVVDADELADFLNTVEYDTVERVAADALAKYNPVVIVESDE